MTGITVSVPESSMEPYPYPRWSLKEEEILRRWHPVLGTRQCSDIWSLLTGRGRSVEQIDNKTRRMGIQNSVPDDWLKLFGGE